MIIEADGWKSILESSEHHKNGVENSGVRVIWQDAIIYPMADTGIGNISIRVALELREYSC